MQTLPQLVSANQELANQIQADIDDALQLEDPDEMQRRLEVIAASELELTDAFAQRANAWVWVIRRLYASAEYFRGQAKYFQKAAQKAENAANSMQSFLLGAMQATGNSKLQTKDFNLSICRASSAPLEIDESYTGDIPDQYRKVQNLEDMIDKVAVKEALRSGKTVPFAKLGTASKYIRGVK